MKKRTIRLIRKRKARPCCCVPPAWITAIPCGITAEDESQQTALPSALAHSAQLRGDFLATALNRQREAFMARWIDGRCSKIMATC
ncbi:hypothetical protein ACLB1E_17855 [Escherichia coli]